MSFEDRRIIKTPLPPTDEEQAAFNAWKAEYERLEQVGLDNQWLDGGWDEPYYPGSPRPSGYEEHRETDEEYERRMKDPWARLHYMYSRSVLDHFTESSAMLNRVVASVVPDVDLTARGGTVTFPVKKRGTFG